MKTPIPFALTLALAMALGLPPAAAGDEPDASKAKVSFEVDGQPVTVRSAGVELANRQDFRMRFEELDINGDGVITRDELPEGHPLQFEWHLADRNRNGRITPEELAAWRGE